MKKIFFSLLLCGLLSVPALAQYQPDKGTKLLNAGIGLGGYGGIGFGNAGLGLGASFEVGVAPNITVGAIAGLQSYSGFGSYYSIGARGSYHFNKLLNLQNDKVDLYGGAGLIYSGFSYKDATFGSAYNYGGIDLGLHVGARYFFTESVGGFAETGIGLAPLQIGVTFRF